MPYDLQLTGLALTGAVVGSFLNVVIHRLPVMIDRLPGEGERYDLALPPSGCPSCGHLLRAWENVPLISYILLRGRCSTCAAPIGWRYPVVEALAAATGPLVALHFGMTEQTLAATVFIWFALAITAIDLRHMLIPDLLSLPLLWLGLLLSTRHTFVAPAISIAGAAIGYLTFYVISRVGARLSGRPVLGMGDAKLFSALGAWLGWSSLPYVALFASVLGTIVSGALILTASRGRSQPVPFGPFLMFGGVAVLLWGDRLINQLPGMWR